MIIDRTSPIPSYFQLQTWLREQIEEGVFDIGTQIPTEEELCRVSGLARATVRQAVMNLVDMGYLERKRRLGTFVLKKTANSGKQTIIGLLLPDIRCGYAPFLARGVQDEAALNRHSVILCDTDDLYVKADFHAERMIENSVSGVIFVPTATTARQNRKVIDMLKQAGIEVVLVDRSIGDDSLDLVTADNFQGAYDMTNYLIRRGHRRIAVTLSTLISTERDRLAGYRQALADSNIPADEKIIITHSGPFAEDKYTEIAHRLLNPELKVSAIFAGHDRIALAIYSAAQKLGIRIPEDISLAGYDDLDFTTVRLTTMHQPIHEMGQESMKLIMQRLGGNIIEPQKIILKSHLVERDSVRDI